MQVHGDDMVAAGALQHVCDELRADGRARLVLLVLSRVGEVWHDGRDAAGRRGFAGFDDDEQLHQAVVELFAWLGRLQDEDVFVAHRFAHYDGGFLVGVFEDGHVEEVDAESGGGGVSGVLGGVLGTG